jgi:hypothetical protein
MGIQFTRVLDRAPIGSVVYTLSFGGLPFTLVSNPGNLFAFSGNQISINAVLSIGSIRTSSPTLTQFNSDVSFAKPPAVCARTCCSIWRTLRSRVG